jgi:hypothetical protein
MVSDKFGSMAVDIGLIFFTATIIFLFIPVFMIGTAPSEYEYLSAFIFFKIGFILTVFYSFVNITFYWLLSVSGLRSIARIYVIFTLIFIMISGFLLPLSSSHGMVDPSDIPVNKSSLFYVIILSFLFTRLIVYNTNIRKIIVVGFSVFLLSTMLTILPDLYKSSFLASKDDRDIKLKAFFELSSKKNILVISLDGLPGYIVNDLIDQSSSMQTIFKDFIIFKNVISNSPGTVASLAGELSGNINLKSVAESQSELVKKTSKNNLLINNQNYELYTYGLYNFFNNKQHRKIQSGYASISISQQINDVFDLYRYVVVRIGTKNSLIVLENISEVFTYAKKNELLADAEDSGGTSLYNRLKNHKGNKTDKNDLLTIYDYYYLMNNLSVSAKELSIRYAHFTFTHYPVDFDEICRYRNDDENWYRSNQNEQGVRNETKCALSQIGNFLKRLKKLGIYDKSLIIFKSDHGKPASYYSSPPYNYKINNNDMGYDRYRPTLMIKNFNQHQDSLSYVNDLVLLADLANTICRVLDAGASCDRLAGVNLLSDQLFSNDPFYIYVPINESSSFHFSTHKPVKLNRGKSLLQSLEDTGNLIAE